MYPFLLHRCLLTLTVKLARWWGIDAGVKVEEGAGEQKIDNAKNGKNRKWKRGSTMTARKKGKAVQFCIDPVVYIRIRVSMYM